MVLSRLVESLSTSPSVERVVAVVAPPAAPGELGLSFRMARGALDLAGSGSGDRAMRATVSSTGYSIRFSSIRPSSITA